jgi:hypothetical protein
MPAFRFGSPLKDVLPRSVMSETSLSITHYHLRSHKSDAYVDKARMTSINRDVHPARRPPAAKIFSPNLSIQ